MIFAARDDSPIRRLILNDVGPVLTFGSIKLLLDRFKSNAVFRDLEDANIYFRRAYSGCGIGDDVDWSDFIVRSINREVDGTYSLHYDPAIINELETIWSDLDVWDVYEKIQCPVLVLRGKGSGVLSREVADRMARVGPKAKIVELEDCGHAPVLVDSKYLSIVSEWLSETNHLIEDEDLPPQDKELGKDQVD
jgi:pimeloyl-ACP methyl ester carboxylesterase